MQNSFPIALQLYSVRAELSENPQTCISNLASLGFTEVEGFDLIQLSQLKPFLDEHLIGVKSSFLLWSHITGRYDLASKSQYPWIPKTLGLEYAIENALELGLDTLVCGYLLPEERASFDCYQRFTEQLNRAGEQCATSGLSLLYHNHGFEFLPVEEGIIPYQYLMENTERAFVNFEVDTLWCQLAGYPLKLLAEKYGDRIRQLHLKTGHPIEKLIFEESDFPPEKHDVPLGEGVLDLSETLEIAYEIGVTRAFLELEYADNMYECLSDGVSGWRFYQSKLL